MRRVPTVAISGCGAVTAEYYVPVLAERARAGRLRIVGLHDPAAARMEAIGAQFPDEVPAASLEEMLALGADLVIIASPPSQHAAQAIAALRAGSDVLCEKPLAIGLEEGRAMVAAAAEADRLLAVAMVRRHFPASLIVERLIRERALGAVLGVEVFEGGPFRWPVRDQSYFSREVSGGGVLADIGVHLLDLLASWLGEPWLLAAEDDAMGGVEANALLDVRFGEVPVTIRLSRDWQRPNLIDLRCERGRIRWSAEEPGQVEMMFDADGRRLRITDVEATARDFLACFGAQVDAVLDRMAGDHRARVVTAAEALPVIALIEQAYRCRRTMAMPWLGVMNEQVAAHVA